ncbi:fungal-specific transcription factor domain-containing protein [Aspergillus coremiiformis]|uniref:Fungal-specific transcription factor domain-containing protein n=1 Tax=Aspergillus coremiiformis TaxID=138285 RepID=A0A5N6Z341_9EURO|nr:fungal-specific transcription factor domain-containing protein [Aspergillus coremiiformis]
MITSTTRRRRAPQACVFCRQRKLKCDNQRPTCATCRAYGRDCIYAVIPRKPRPSNRRLSQLEEENRQLRQRLQTERPTSSSELCAPIEPPEHALPQPRTDSSATLPAVEDPGQTASSTVSRIFISPDGESSYHGRTSTLFDDTATDQRVLQTLVANPRMPVEWIKKGLMGEAAYQRQMEPLNFQDRKLDFDGEDPELGMHLLSLHWNRQHYSFLIAYRPAFMRDMADGGPYFSKLLLNAIYFGASKFSPRLEVRRTPEDVRTAGWRYRRRVKELLGSALDRSEITTIQALLVMTSSLFALGDERSAAWLYAGTAFRMIIDLGMHVDALSLPNMRRLSDEDLEIRRRVFWGAFVVDKIQSLYQGRPPSLQDSDTNVPLTFLDRYEELEYWMPFAYSGNPNVRYSGSPAYSVSTFTELCKLSVILNGILNKVYSERSPKRASEEMVSNLRTLDSDLQQWHEGLPSHLKFDQPHDSPPPHVLSLLALYHVLVILLHRPFVAEGHLHNTAPSIALTSFRTCATAANAIIRLLQRYEETFSIRRAPYLISYATYVAATILVRIAAQREWDSPAHARLRTCLSVFDENQETNWAVRRAKQVVIHLMERMGVSLDRTHRPLDRPHRRSGSADHDRSLRLPAISTVTTKLPDATRGDPLDLNPFITQGNSGIPFPDTWSPPMTVLGESGPVGLRSLEGCPSDHRPPGGGLSFHDMLFGFNGSGQDIP